MNLVPLELAPGVNPAEIRFGELGYCREARISYQDFCAARDRGDVPQDVRFQVSLANAIVQAAEHPLAYVHVPVPIARGDDAYFKPFRDLRLDPGTDIYLGLVHEDGPEGSSTRSSNTNGISPPSSAGS